MTFPWPNYFDIQNVDPEIRVHHFLCLRSLCSEKWAILWIIINWHQTETALFFSPFFCFPEKHLHSCIEGAAFHEKITFLCLSKFPFIYAKKSRLMPCLLFSWVWISFPAPVKWREEWTLSFLSAWLDITGNGNRQDPIFFPVILTLKILMLEWVLFNPRLNNGHFQATRVSFFFHI